MSHALNKILVGVILAILIASFVGGCEYGKSRVKCPVVASDSILVHDTNWVIIHDTAFYPLKPDTVINVDTFLVDVDTAAILKNYFNQYGYAWEKKDSNILMQGYTIISQNKILQNEIKYKWLQPTQIINNNIDNSITYTKYLYGGLGVPFKDLKYINLEVMYAFPKGYVGGMWTPELKSFGVKAGVTFLKFK